MFTLGGSSGDDDESSFEDRMMHAPRHSSLSDQLEKRPGSNLNPKNKVTTFKDQAADLKSMRDRRSSNDEDAIETDDDISESAIEDDEDSDWEDSVTESGRSSVEEKGSMFQRGGSRPNLVSRRSLLTMMMHQPLKMGHASRSTPAL